MNPVNEHGDMIAISQYYRLASDFVAKLQTAAQENEALRNEVDEQARLNGKGSEREAALLAKVERLERQKALQGLHLATMADVVLGENANDRSDETLVREVCKMARENPALRADKERLDWLESAAKDLICTGDGLSVTIGVASNFQNYATNAATFRSAIDAARKKQP